MHEEVPENLSENADAPRPEPLLAGELDDAPPAGSLSAAAQALRARLASQGIELAEEVQLAEVPGPLLDALLEAWPAPPEPRRSEEELRSELADRVARSQRLPRGVRERLAASLASVRFDDSGRDEPALRVSDAVALLEETLPAQVLLSPDAVELTAHPRGDGFFHGDPRQISDDDARRIAGEQLLRTGYRQA